MSFWGELKRRNIFKVGAAYVIIAWIIVQVANTFFPILHLPDWSVTLVAVLVLLGLPITLVIAWAFELTPEGVKRSENVAPDESITHVTGRKINCVLGGLLVIAVALLIFDNYYLDRRVVKTETASVVPKEVPAVTEVKESETTIAVLPFSDLSPDKNQGYFVDGLSEELLNCLANINGLRVTSRTSSFAFKDTNKTLQEVARILGVDHILEGSVRKSGNSLRITAQLIRVRDDSHLWSESYNRELNDIFAVQEDIAATVADKLKLTLGIGQTFKQLGGTDNVEAYELYLVAQGLLQEANISSVKRALESIEAAITLDPKFALAWVLKGAFHLNLASNSSANRIPFELEAALNSVQRAFKIEPNLAEAYFLLGGYQQQKGNLIEAGSSFRQALALKNEPSFEWLRLWIHYLTVGYLEKAQEIIETLRINDPLNQSVRSNYVSSLDLRQAEKENERCRDLFGDNWKNSGWAISIVRMIDKDSVSPEEIIHSTSFIFETAKEYLGSPEEGLDVLKQIYGEEENLSNNLLTDIAIWAAYFGDHDFALDAVERASSKTSARTFLIWSPLMKEARKLPRFKEWVREIGIVHYWEKFGWPDLCRPTDDGDFVCE